jgi:hypothetical protein
MILLIRTLLQRPDLGREMETLTVRVPTDFLDSSIVSQMPFTVKEEFLSDCASHATSLQGLWGSEDRSSLLRWVSGLLRGTTTAIYILILTPTPNLKSLCLYTLQSTTESGSVTPIYDEANTIFGTIGYHFPANVVSSMITTTKLELLNIQCHQLVLAEDLDLPRLKNLVVWMPVFNIYHSTKQIRAPKLEYLDIRLAADILLEENSDSISLVLSGIGNGEDEPVAIVTVEMCFTTFPQEVQ